MSPATQNSGSSNTLPINSYNYEGKCSIYPPRTTKVKFCSSSPMEVLATQTYTAESFNIRFSSVYCSVRIRELPGVVLRTTSSS